MTARGLGFKAVRYLYWIVRRPNDLAGYLRYFPRPGMSPLRAGLPWISFAAIDWLEANLRPGMSVLEYGSGGSTLFLARRVRRVLAVEEDDRWADRVEVALGSELVRKVEIRRAQFDYSSSAGFSVSDYVRVWPAFRPDLILVDGNEAFPEARPICFAHAEDLIGPGGVILVDDAWRYRRLRSSTRAQRVEHLESLGPCRKGATCTDAYFY